MRLSLDQQVCTGGASDPTELDFCTVMAQMHKCYVVIFSAFKWHFSKTPEKLTKVGQRLKHT